MVDDKIYSLIGRFVVRTSIFDALFDECLFEAASLFGAKNVKLERGLPGSITRRLDAILDILGDHVSKVPCLETSRFGNQITFRNFAVRLEEVRNTVVHSQLSALHDNAGSVSLCYCRIGRPGRKSELTGRLEYDSIQTKIGAHDIEELIELLEGAIVFVEQSIASIGWMGAHWSMRQVSRPRSILHNQFKVEEKIRRHAVSGAL